MANHKLPVRCSVKASRRPPDGSRGLLKRRRGRNLAIHQKIGTIIGSCWLPLYQKLNPLEAHIRLEFILAR